MNLILMLLFICICGVNEILRNNRAFSIQCTYMVKTFGPCLPLCALLWISSYQLFTYQLLVEVKNENLYGDCMTFLHVFFCFLSCSGFCSVFIPHHTVLHCFVHCAHTLSCVSQAVPAKSACNYLPLLNHLAPPVWDMSRS